MATKTTVKTIIIDECDMCQRGFEREEGVESELKLFVSEFGALDEHFHNQHLCERCTRRGEEHTRVLRGHYKEIGQWCDFLEELWKIDFNYRFSDVNNPTFGIRYDHPNYKHYVKISMETIYSRSYYSRGKALRLTTDNYDIKNKFLMKNFNGKYTAEQLASSYHKSVWKLMEKLIAIDEAKQEKIDYAKKVENGIGKDFPEASPEKWWNSGWRGRGGYESYDQQFKHGNATVASSGNGEYYFRSFGGGHYTADQVKELVALAQKFDRSNARKKAKAKSKS